MRSPAASIIRPYRPDDLPAVMDVCLRTAAQGRDGSALVSDLELPGLLSAMTGASMFYARTGFQVLERHATWTEMGIVLMADP